MSTHTRKRDESQVIMSGALSRELLAAVDDYCAVNDMTRSQFLRSAFCNELKLRGVTVDNALLRAPAKAGRPPIGEKDAYGGDSHTSNGDFASHGRGAQIINLGSPKELERSKTIFDSTISDSSGGAGTGVPGGDSHTSHGNHASHGRNAKIINVAPSKENESPKKG